jgi:hypothetical protein
MPENQDPETTSGQSLFRRNTRPNDPLTSVRFERRGMMILSALLALTAVVLITQFAADGGAAYGAGLCAAGCSIVALSRASGQTGQILEIEIALENRKQLGQLRRELAHARSATVEELAAVASEVASVWQQHVDAEQRVTNRINDVEVKTANAVRGIDGVLGLADDLGSRRNGHR